MYKYVVNMKLVHIYISYPIMIYLSRDENNLENRNENLYCSMKPLSEITPPIW